MTSHAKGSRGAELQSISAIKLGPDNALFVGDSKAAAVYAFDLGDTTAKEGSQSFNILGIDQKIADLLGAHRGQVSVKDMAVHPVTKEAYIALHRGHGNHVTPV